MTLTFFNHFVQFINKTSRCVSSYLRFQEHPILVYFSQSCRRVRRKCAAAAAVAKDEKGKKRKFSTHKLNVIEVKWESKIYIMFVQSARSVRGVLCANRAVNHIRRQ
jgi:hypothetical protein